MKSKNKFCFRNFELKIVFLNLFQQYSAFQVIEVEDLSDKNISKVFKRIDSKNLKERIKTIFFFFFFYFWILNKKKMLNRERFKICVLGTGGVGKSALAIQFSQSKSFFNLLKYIKGFFSSKNDGKKNNNQQIK